MQMFSGGKFRLRVFSCPEGEQHKRDAIAVNVRGAMDLGRVVERECQE
jgi:hypothetical protein